MFGTVALDFSTSIHIPPVCSVEICMANSEKLTIYKYQSPRRKV